MDKKVDISGHVPVIPSISNKSVNSKRDTGRRGVVDILPQLKTKLYIQGQKEGLMSQLTNVVCQLSHYLIG